MRLYLTAWPISPPPLIEVMGTLVKNCFETHGDDGNARAKTIEEGTVQNRESERERASEQERERKRGRAG
jgi:hypothetical protein